MRAGYMPTLSKSRIITAICARLAASATRVKSRRKGSVDEPWSMGCGWGSALWAGDWCVNDAAEADDVDDAWALD